MEASTTQLRPTQVSVLVAALAAATGVCAAIVLASDAAAQSPFHPAIQIASSPSVQTLQTKVVTRLDSKTHTRKPTLAFGTARFTIRVSNPGSFGLSGVKVTDPRSPGCSRTIGTLAPGVSIAYSCSATNVRTSYTNVAAVSGRPSQGVRHLTSVQAAVTATATSRVRVTTTVTTRAGVPSFTG